MINNLMYSLIQALGVLLITEKDRKEPKRTEKGRKGPKRAKKDRK